MRNTHDPDCKISPAEIVFGRQLRDAFTFLNRTSKYTNRHVRPAWRDAWKKKEDALRMRFTRSCESLTRGTRALPELSAGDHVIVQNQQGQHPTKWDRSGIVVEVRGNHQYIIKIDGSGRLTLRNRQFLRKATPPSTQICTPIHGIAPAPELMTAPTDPRVTNSRSVPTTPDNATDLDESHDTSELVSDTPAASLPQTTTDSTNESRAPAPVTTTQEHCTDVREVVPSMRPRRHSKQPLRYIPESGKWE